MENSKALRDKQTNAYRIEKIELKNAKLLYSLMSILLILDWVMPQYFGFHIGFDFTCTRIMNVIIVLYFVFNRKAGNHFIRSMLDVQVTPFLGLYMLVMIYTTILRVNVNTFFLNFLDILTFYMVYYGIRYVIGVNKAIKWSVGVAWVIGIYGLIEYALGTSPLIEFLQTLPSDAYVVYRSGVHRIMGPCVHPIGYGMLLIFLIAIICIDYENDDMYLFKHPVLFGILLINMFLTGSRGPLGVAFAEIALIIIFSKKDTRKKSLIYLVIFLVCGSVIETAIIGTSFGRYIMMQITSVIDEILGTSYAVNFGADTTVLNQSSSYRDLLPRIFGVSWLNPLLGKGANAGVSFEFDGRAVQSVDNFYVCLYIRYAYPGMITYILFLAATIFTMLKTGFKYNSGISKLLAFAIILYCVNLWVVDYLQTSKYMYILIAIYAAYYSEKILNR